MAFNTPSFQRQLHEISRQFEKQSPSFKKAFLKLVRTPFACEQRDAVRVDAGKWRWPFSTFSPAFDG